MKLLFEYLLGDGESNGHVLGGEGESNGCNCGDGETSG